MSSSLDNKRHTLAHALAAAVLQHFKDAKPTIGPSTDSGFYYDFETPTPIGEKDLPAIEQTLKEIIRSWKKYSSKTVSAEEAKEFFKNNPYKLELIEEIEKKGEPITFYTFGDFTDLCRGGHSEDATEIKGDAFYLDRIAGAYWRGDEKNKMLTRIYGIAFETKEELESYKKMRVEAEARDHRKLGKELDLFVFSDIVGKGLPLLTESGSTIRRELERFIVDEEIKRDYKHVYTPCLAKIDLYKKSGHYPYYQDSMYRPIDIDGEQFMLRPMTCPHHFEIYLSKPRSYRELPMRIAELADLFRYEQSGELTGLIRVRSFCLADAHIICKDSTQAADEVNKALDLIEYIAGTFGLVQGKDYSYRLSLGDRSNTEKYYKDDAAWDDGEGKLRDVLTKRGATFVEAPAEAAFYGPKIDIQMRDVRGKENTAFTVQYDFVMPKRFELTYIDNDGKTKEAIVIHRSSIGALERIMAFIIERFAGRFPLWLSPMQVAVIPVLESHTEAATKIAQTFKEQRLRVSCDTDSNGLGKKIRAAKESKTPYWIVVGDKEVASNSYTLEKWNGEKTTGTMEELLKKLVTERDTRAL